MLISQRNTYIDCGHVYEKHYRDNISHSSAKNSTELFSDVSGQQQKITEIYTIPSM